MIPRLVFVLAFVAALPAFAADPCDTGSAKLPGGYTQPYPGLGDYVYWQELTLERQGPGLQGLWIGTHYSQSNTYPFALTEESRAAAVLGGLTAIPSIDADCHAETPAANTIVSICTARMPFMVHGDGSITWQGQSTVIGHASGTSMTIDMMAGAPGYDAQSVVSGKMTGNVFPAGDLGIHFEAKADGPLTPEPAPSWRFTVKGIGDPADTDVVLLASVTRTVGGGPVIVPNAAADMVTVLLRSSSPATRLEQAAAVEIEAVLTRGRCSKSHTVTLLDVLNLVALSP